MHHIPHPKDQAETLMRIAKANGWKLGKQEALEVVAEMQGFKSWQVCSAATNEGLKGEQPEKLKLEPALIVEPCNDKDGKQLFRGIVTMDATMSAEFGVWATNREDAEERFSEFALARYEKNGGADFMFDEGNHKRLEDFYPGELDEFENLSLDIEQDHDMFARATWADERGSYDVIFSRDEPDCSDDDRRFAVTVTLSVTPNIKGATSVSKEFTGDDCWSVDDDELESQLEFDVKNGNFDDEIDALLKKSLRDLKRSLRAKAH